MTEGLLRSQAPANHGNNDTISFVDWGHTGQLYLMQAHGACERVRHYACGCHAACDSVLKDDLVIRLLELAAVPNRIVDGSY